MHLFFGGGGASKADDLFLQSVTVEHEIANR